MATPEEIDHQKQLLVAHRRTLAHLLSQQAQFSAGHVPTHVANGIQRIKQVLRAWGETAEDLPDDEDEDHVPPSSVSPARQRSFRWPPLLALIGLLAIGIAVVASFITAPSTPVSPATATTTTNWSTAYRDTFDQVTGNWSEGSIDNGDLTATYNITNGLYHWKVSDTKKENVYFQQILKREVNVNSRVSLKIRNFTGDTEAKYGIVFRLDDNNNYYCFEVNHSTNEFAVIKHTATETYLEDIEGKPLTWTTAQTVSNISSIAVEMDGSKFTFFINDNKVAQADALDINGEAVGIRVHFPKKGTSATFAFEEFEILSKQ
jgi:hypothetical protein